MNKAVYYFSGTGNSYRFAMDISEQLSDAKLINMVQRQEAKHTNYSTIGLVFPLYYFGLPVIVEEFIKNLEIPNDCYVFVIVTRGEPFAGGVKRQLDKLFHYKERKYQLFRYVLMGNNYPFHTFNCSTDNTKSNRNRKAKLKADQIMSIIQAQQKSRIFSILDYQPFSWITRNIPTFGYRHFKQIYNNDTCFTVHLFSSSEKWSTHYN